MKRFESLSVNLRMTKYLFLASPSYFLINLANTLLQSAAFIFTTLFFRYLIDFVVYVKGTLNDIILHFTVYFIVLALLRLVDHWVREKYDLREKLKITLYYKQLICNESARKELKNHSFEQYTNQLYNAVYHDGNYFSSFSGLFFGFLDAVVTFLFFFGMFLQMHPFFSLLVVLQTINELVHANVGHKLGYERYQVEKGYYQIFQHIRNVFYLKQYKKEQQIYPIADLYTENYKRNAERLRREKEGIHLKIDLCTTATNSIKHLINAGNMVLLVWLLVNGKITIGDFQVVLTNFTATANNLTNMILFFAYVADDARYMKDIFAVMDTPNHQYPEIEHSSAGQCVKFSNVDFSYDGERKVLKDIGIELPLDQKIAIVGENGSGKTTFVKLLLGLYEPDRGRVEYRYPKQEIADTSQLFGVLLQDFRVFALSVSENIALRSVCDETDREKMEEAIRFSGLKEKINTLPDGLDTELTGEFSDSGTYLSGGEMQKLAIARAYMMDRPVLILDEPSSNLDPISENALIHRINQLTKNKGVILITHNMSYAKNVDLVIVFHEGRIVEYGTPDELRERKGYFYSMVEEQRKAVGGSIE